MNQFSRSFINLFKRYSNREINKALYSSDMAQTESKGHLLLLTIPVASFCLGTWQVKRLEWKKGLIRDLEQRTHSAPVPLPSDILTPDKMDEMQYKRVIVNGHFDHAQEILLGPRSLNESGSNKGGGIISRPTIGFHIVTPFVLDSGERILVNRGWVPKDKKNPESRLQGQITENIQLTGHFRKGEKRPTFSPRANESGFNWHYLDVESFSRLLDTTPLLIDADSVSTVPGGPIGGQTRVNVRNEHMQYIITWYTLAALTAIMYYQFRKKPRAMFKAGPIMKE